MRTLSVLIAAAVAVGLSGPASAAERIFSHAPAGATPYLWGTEKAERYDVAVRVADPAFVGKRITGFTVPLSSERNISDVSGWLSSELKVEKKVNVPDIASKAAVIHPEGSFHISNQDGDYDMPLVEVVFDEPYTITEDGVYIGYTFTVSSVDDGNTASPMVVTYGESAGGCYLHTSRTYLSWKDAIAENWGMVSYIQVNMEGDFLVNAVAPEGLQSMHAASGSDCVVKGRLVNHGVGEVTSVDYSYTFGGKSDNGHIDLENPLAADFGSAVDVAFPVSAPEEEGMADCSVTVTGVNGLPNEDAAPSASTSVDVVAFIPVMRPLMEEYTGTWCQYCPRGYIALERMKHKYPDRFVALSYHSSSSQTKDPMQCLLEFPGTVEGYPGAILNRNGQFLDPFFGSDRSMSDDMYIEADWQRLADSFTIADIDVHVGWEDESFTRLKAAAEVRFVKDCRDSDYRITYVLVGDNLTGERWKGTQNEWYQVNAFSGSELEGDDWDVFTKGESFVFDLIFNDIVLAYEGDVAGSLPSDIEGKQTNWHSFVFDLSKVRNIYGDDIINDKSSLRVVAILTDARTGEFINCNSSGYAATSGVRTHESLDSPEVVRICWHDLSGRPVSRPSSGIYVRTVFMNDGTVRHDKVVM